MSHSPIARALSTLRAHQVQSLLMGGQACILYGAAEFSRDADLAVFASPENLDHLRAALADLDATVVAVPPLEAEYLDRGHAVHFRGFDPFPELWERRTVYEMPDGIRVEALSLPDLVASKKTQRDKDWPMIRRLLEADYDRFYGDPSEERARFWLEQLRHRRRRGRQP